MRTPRRQHRHRSYPVAHDLDVLLSQARRGEPYDLTPQSARQILSPRKAGAVPPDRVSWFAASIAALFVVELVGVPR
jgi:hypothetical protein